VALWLLRTRRELCPGSDVDVLLLHDLRSGCGGGRADASVVPPVGRRLPHGHAVRTPGESIRRGRPRPGHADVPARRAPGGGGLRSEAGDVGPPPRPGPPATPAAPRDAGRGGAPPPEQPGTIALHRGAGPPRTAPAACATLQAPVLGRTAVGVGPGLHGLTASGVVDDSDAAELRARRSSPGDEGWPCTGRRVGDRTCSPYRTAPPWPRSPAAATATTSCGRWPA